MKPKFDKVNGSGGRLISEIKSNTEGKGKPGISLVTKSLKSVTSGTYSGSKKSSSTDSFLGPFLYVSIANINDVWLLPDS